MPKQLYDLAIIGAGVGGLIAAGFAVQLGAKVALVENHRIGGDCLELEQRLEIVRTVFQDSEKATVHLKDSASGPGSFFTFV
jgi:flavin-dependent dehydrogenase